MKSLWRSSCLGKLIVLALIFVAGSVAIALAVQILVLAIRAWALLGVPTALVIGLLLYKSERAKRWLTQHLPDLALPLSEKPGLTSSAIAALFAATALGAASLPVGSPTAPFTAITPRAPVQTVVSAAVEVADTPTAQVIARILPTVPAPVTPTTQPTPTPPPATATLVPMAPSSTPEPPAQSTPVAAEPSATPTRRPRPRPTVVIQPSATAEVQIVPLEPPVETPPTALPPPALVEVPPTVAAPAVVAPAQPVEPAPSGARTGAICKDGTRSDATGRGACSHHGGVDHWLY